ncbi:MAG: glycosyltransferase family 39 protein [Clostridia bacterium]|nr:glycosyltransferase family 39 protein [Clostridia bacterium]
MKKFLKWEYGVVLLMALLGMFLRLYVIREIPTTQITDFDSYYKIAVNVATGYGFQLDGFPIAFQGMGFSTLLGIWFKIFNSTTQLTAKYFNVFLSMMTIAVLYVFLLQLVKKRGLRLVLIGAVIFFPQHIFYCNTIGSEVLSVFLLSLTLMIFVLKFNSWMKWILLGVVIGALALTKPFFIAYPLVIFASVWLSEKKLKKALSALVITFVAMALVIAPWTYRNYQKFDRFIPISYNSGFNLYINNNPHNTEGGWQSFDDIYKTPELQEKINMHLDNPLHSVKIASDIELDFKPEAMHWIKNNLDEFMKLGVIRIQRTYFNGTWDIEYWTMNDYRESQKDEDPYLLKRQMNFMKSLNDILLATVSVFGLWFILVHFKTVLLGFFNKKELNIWNIILFLNLSYVSLVYFVYEGQSRYNFVVLFLLIFAAGDWISQYIEKKEA